MTINQEVPNLVLYQPQVIISYSGMAKSSSSDLEVLAPFLPICHSAPTIPVSSLFGEVVLSSQQNERKPFEIIGNLAGSRR
jgi:hypothetical protein